MRVSSMKLHDVGPFGDAEWQYAAAGGSEQREFPWGNVPRSPSSGEPDPTNPGTMNQYAIYSCYYPDGSGTCAGGATNVAPVGTATLGAGLWGQLDLLGDAQQWTLDWYAAYTATCVDCADTTVPPAGPAQSGRISRGVTAFAGGSLPPLGTEPMGYYTEERDDRQGIRCARTP